jgi:hypothetical protein
VASNDPLLLPLIEPVRLVAGAPGLLGLGKEKVGLAEGLGVRNALGEPLLVPVVEGVMLGLAPNDSEAVGVAVGVPVPDCELVPEAVCVRVTDEVGDTV